MIRKLMCALGLVAALFAGLVSPTAAFTGDPSVDGRPFSSYPNCVYEDGSGGPTPCKWDARVRGNGTGKSYVVRADGSIVYIGGANVYNLSNHGMWMVRNWPGTANAYYGLASNDIFWVPSNTWSSAVYGQGTAGFFTGAGWCALVYRSNGVGGWSQVVVWKGPATVSLADTPEWMLQEYPC